MDEECRGRTPWDDVEEMMREEEEDRRARAELYGERPQTAAPAVRPATPPAPSPLGGQAQDACSCFAPGPGDEVGQMLEEFEQDQRHRAERAAGGPRSVPEPAERGGPGGGSGHGDRPQGSPPIAADLVGDLRLPEVTDPSDLPPREAQVDPLAVPGFGLLSPTRRREIHDAIEAGPLPATPERRAEDRQQEEDDDGCWIGSEPQPGHNGPSFCLGPGRFQASLATSVDPDGARMDVGFIDSSAGVIDGPDGGRRIGVRSEGGLLRIEDPSVDGAPEVDVLDRDVGVEGAILTGGSEVSFGTDGLTIGAGGTAIGGAASYGDFSRSRQDDYQVRGGLSEGPGVAVRARWSDVDEDDDREWGGGVDIGPLTGDVAIE